MQLVVNADHFQILMGDREKGPLVDTSELWSSTASIPSVSGAPELIALPIASLGGRVGVELVLSAKPPDVEVLPWQCLGAFRLEVPSGDLLLWGPELEDLETAVRVKVPAGTYEEVAYARDQGQATDENVGEGAEQYRLVLWPADGDRSHVRFPRTSDLH